MAGNKGTIYHQLLTGGYFPRLDSGELSQKEVSRMLGCSHVSVKDARAKHRATQEQDAKGFTSVKEANWEPSPPPLDRANIQKLVDHFTVFRARFFELSPGKPYLTPKHQRRWLTALLLAYLGGGKQLVLSPPRHGKTELLAHICIWLIAAVDPNIRILRVGGNEEIALDSVGMVRNELANNEELVKAYLPPGDTWQPRQRGGVWRESRFTVETRTLVRKSPTMVGVGRGGKLLSRDADIIIVDDIEEEQSVLTEQAREQTRTWWARSVMSRIEPTTAVFVIGSRQHPDDIYGHLIEDPNWNKIVEQVHDEACELPDDDNLWHKHKSCLLWWEVRDYRWVLAKKRDPLVAPIFDLVYQNKADNSVLSTFSRELVDSICDPTRTRGDIPSHNCMLIAGLDPSATGYQSAVLYAFDPLTNKRYVVDIDNRIGGGIQKARQQIEAWVITYGCRWWAVEENLYHGAILKDEILKAYCQREQVHLEKHETTGVNKWSPVYGISTLANWMEAGLYSIPWKTDKDKAHFQPLRQQFINFSQDLAQTKSISSRLKYKTDLVMAAWFPERRMKNWHQEALSETSKQETATRYPFATFDDAYSRMALGSTWS